RRGDQCMASCPPGNPRTSFPGGDEVWRSLLPHARITTRPVSHLIATRTVSRIVGIAAARAGAGSRPAAAYCARRRSGSPRANLTEISAATPRRSIPNPVAALVSVQGRDVDEDGGVNATEHVNRHPVLADRFDLLLERHLMAIDLDPFLCQELGDLAIGHRAEEAVLFAGLDTDLETDAAQLLRRRFRVRLQRFFAVLALRAMPLPVLECPGIGHLHGACRDQEIARIAVFDVLDLALAAETPDVPPQDHLHGLVASPPTREREFRLVRDSRHPARR